MNLLSSDVICRIFSHMSPQDAVAFSATWYGDGGGDDDVQLSYRRLFLNGINMAVCMSYIYV